jgi:hypothetical protein
MDRPDVSMMYVVHKAFRRDLARMQAAAARAVDPDVQKALHPRTPESFPRPHTSD